MNSNLGPPPLEAWLDEVRRSSASSDGGAERLASAVRWTVEPEMSSLEADPKAYYAFAVSLLDVFTRERPRIR
jgi:hypothetical protein